MKLHVSLLFVILLGGGASAVHGHVISADQQQVGQLGGVGHGAPRDGRLGQGNAIDVERYAAIQAGIPISRLAQIVTKRDSDKAYYSSAAQEPYGGGRRTIITSPSTRRNFRIAHGTFMGTAFVVVLPAGAILLRLLPVKHVVAIHASLQVFGYALVAVGAGLGIWLGLNVRYLDYAHTVIGLVVLSLLALQTGLGLLGHVWYRRKEKSNLALGVHAWLGRVLVILGMVNGGIGLNLAKNTRAGEIAYGTVAGVVGTALMGVSRWNDIRKKRNNI